MFPLTLERSETFLLEGLMKNSESNKSHISANNKQDKQKYSQENTVL